MVKRVKCLIDQEGICLKKLLTWTLQKILLWERQLITNLVNLVTHQDLKMVTTSTYVIQIRQAQALYIIMDHKWKKSREFSDPPGHMKGYPIIVRGSVVWTDGRTDTMREIITTILGDLMGSKTSIANLWWLFTKPRP